MKEYERIYIAIMFFNQDDVFCGASMEDGQSGGDLIIDDEDLFG